jgi:hypothetical protein
MENGDPARDEQFLAWITSSVRARLLLARPRALIAGPAALLELCGIGV